MFLIVWNDYIDFHGAFDSGTNFLFHRAPTQATQFLYHPILKKIWLTKNATYKNLTESCKIFLLIPCKILATYAFFSNREFKLFFPPLGVYGLHAEFITSTYLPRHWGAWRSG